MAMAIALLRAVNVGGRSVAMAELTALAERLGLQDVRSLLQTGNLVFRSSDPADASLETRLEAAARSSLGLDTAFMVRTAAAWAAALAANPFPAEAERDPGRLVLVTLKGTPEVGAIEALRAAIKGRERVELTADVLFAVYPDGIGRSKLTLPLIEKKLGTRGTGRNWNTATKIAALAGV